jgi:hypothetical protein
MEAGFTFFSVCPLAGWPALTILGSSKMGLTELKSRCWWMVFFLEAPGGLFTCLFQLLETTYIPWLLAPSSIFDEQQRIFIGSKDYNLDIFGRHYSIHHTYVHPTRKCP